MVDYESVVKPVAKNSAQQIVLLPPVSVMFAKINNAKICFGSWRKCHLSTAGKDCVVLEKTTLSIILPTLQRATYNGRNSEETENSHLRKETILESECETPETWGFKIKN